MIGVPLLRSPGLARDMTLPNGTKKSGFLQVFFGKYGVILCWCCTFTTHIALKVTRCKMSISPCVHYSGGSRISPRWGRQLARGRQHTILPKFPKNCMKLKEFGLGGGASKILLCRSATALAPLPYVVML